MKYRLRELLRTGALLCESPDVLLIPFSVFLVTVHDPICTDSGDLNAALYGSFLPIPADSLFPSINLAVSMPANKPGAIIAKPDAIPINKGRERIKLRVANNGDRPIQVRPMTKCTHPFF